MFAPYCASCESRVLLGTGRIVRFADAETGALDVVLRCWCGADVPADAKAPVPVPVPAPVPALVPGADPADRVAYATHAAAAC